MGPRGPPGPSGAPVSLLIKALHDMFLIICVTIMWKICLYKTLLCHFYPRGHRDSKEARVRLESLVQL